MNPNMSRIEEDRASGFEVMQLELELQQTLLLNSGLGLSILVSGLPWLEASKRFGLNQTLKSWFTLC